MNMRLGQIGLPLLLIVKFFAFGLFSFRHGLVVTALLAFWLRWISFRNLMLQPNPSMWDVINAFVSHTIGFAALFIIFQSEFTIMDTSNPVMDSLFYSVDTVTTNGAGRIYPVTSIAKTIHVINLLDSYFLFITLGYFIIQNIRSSPRGIELFRETPGIE